jgi:hypothetical protein
VFLKPVLLKNIIRLFGEVQSISGISFDRKGKYSFTKKAMLRHKNVISHPHPSFIIRRADAHGPPALIRRIYARQVGRALYKSDKDVRPKHMGRVDSKVGKLYQYWRHAGVYLGEDCRGEIVKDIGREWQKKKGFKVIKR